MLTHRHSSAKMVLKEKTSIYLALVSSLLCIINTTADEAIPLISVKENQGNGEARFFLDPEAIFLIKQLPSPVKVIAAIGDARVGKSTALNFIRYTLNNLGTSTFHTKNVEEIFETGNTMNPVTHGVWIAKPSGTDNMILLDVEGTDLGNDAVTDKLSIFTALTSSTLMLFMKESPSTHIIDFLYKIVRLSELAFGKKKSEHFPRLTVVLRGALEPPEEYKNIKEYMTDALIASKWDDKSDEKRRAIGTRFPREQIEVFDLPYDPKLLKKPKTKGITNQSEYLESIEKLTKHMFQSPEKKSLEGAVLDGRALTELAKNLVEIMNDKMLWDKLNPDFYALFEENLCRKSYEKYIEPLLRIKERTAREIETLREKKLRLFSENCKLDKWITKAEMNIDFALKSRKDYENEPSLIWDIASHILSGAIGFMARGFVSDVQLKESITVLNNSEYEAISLRGVEWVWNQEAESLGLSGNGSGVVAQEVELLYPWAVTEGYDGYKRVNYPALRLLIWAKKFQRKA